MTKLTPWAAAAATVWAAATTSASRPLNALLVEMDGFDTQEGIIIIAATNRPDVLDPALLRPGRFDRQITVNLPDVRGREAILKVHAKNVKLAPAVDLSVIARGTPGYSGAELANLLNEAALLAARTNKKAVGMTELEEARDKVRWGRERRSLAMTDEDKKFTAWHEAGHALVNVMLKHTHPLHKVTIIPRGQSLGFDHVAAQGRRPEPPPQGNARHDRRDDGGPHRRGNRLRRHFHRRRRRHPAGHQHGARDGLQWGMSDKLGMVQYGDDNEYVFLGRDMMRSKDYSEYTAQEIDDEVKRIIDEAYQIAKDIIDNTSRQAGDDRQVPARIRNPRWLAGGGNRAHRQVHAAAADARQVEPPHGAPAGTPLPETAAKPAPPKLPGLGTPAPATAWPGP